MHSRIIRPLLANVIAMLLHISTQPVLAQAQPTDKRETIHRCLLAIYQCEKGCSEVEAEYQSLIAIKSDDAQLHFDYGKYLSSKGNISAALIQIKQAIKLEPQNADYWKDLGYELMQIQDYSGATDAYRHAIECSSGSDYRSIGDFLGPDGKLLMKHHR